jgi:glycosyltransferase involved in cell wall biosynthesis
MTTILPRKPLRIGINILFLLPGKVGGTEIYTRNVLSALAHVDSTNRYYVFRNLETDSGIVPNQSNFFDCPQAVRATSRPARIIYEQTLLVGEVVRRRLDILLNGGLTAPLLCPVNMATVFFDLQYKVHPENLSALELLVYRTLLPASARRSTRIIAMCEAARAQLDRFFPWSSSKIDIVPHGIEDEFARIAVERERSAPAGDYILAVSTLDPHKNYDGLLAAFARYRIRHPGMRLVIVGIKGPETVRLEALRRELGLDESVEFTGWVTRERLYRFFRDAVAFVYPSRFEGFGIPVLEALSAGIPTACSSIPSLLEIASGSARFFEPDDIADMAAAMAEITDDAKLRETLIAAGKQRSVAFTWAQSAKSLLASLNRTASSR